MEIQEEDIQEMREALSGVSDPRRQWGALRHKLVDILVVGLCSITVRGEGFDEMEDLGKAWESWFRKFLELPHGIPDEDTFRRVFERVNPAQLMECLQLWLSDEPCRRKASEYRRENHSRQRERQRAERNTHGQRVGQ